MFYHPRSSVQDPGGTAPGSPASSPSYLDYLDQVQDCLEEAGFSESACLEGIQKATAALQQCSSYGDDGVQCTILMNRARLLFTAVSVYSRTPLLWTPS